MAQWYYARGGKSHGPVSAYELQLLWTEGSLSETDLVWREQLAEWVPLRSVQEQLSNAIPPPLPPAVPRTPVPSTPEHAHTEPLLQSDESNTTPAEPSRSVESPGIAQSLPPTEAGGALPAGDPPPSGTALQGLKRYRFQPTGGVLGSYSVEELRELRAKGLLQRHYVVSAEGDTTSIEAGSIPGLFPDAPIPPLKNHWSRTSGDGTGYAIATIILFGLILPLVFGYRPHHLFEKLGFDWVKREQEAEAAVKNDDAKGIASLAFRDPEAAFTKYGGSRISVVGTVNLTAANGICEFKVRNGLFVAFNIADLEGSFSGTRARFSGRVQGIRYLGKPPLIKSVVIVLDQVKREP